MRILVTGAKGFVGKNLCAQLNNIKEGKDQTHPELSIESVYEYDIDSTMEELDAYCKDCDFVFVGLFSTFAQRGRRRVFARIFRSGRSL